MDGWKRQHEDSVKQGYLAYQMYAGIYHGKTDEIDIDLDVATNAFFGLDCADHEQATPEQIDDFVEALARLILHEHVHSALNKYVSRKACSAWDSDSIHRMLVLIDEFIPEVEAK
jgi:hypothetical protein